MEIKTKFDVNNFAKAKFDVDPINHQQVLEVMEILSQTCYGGTQIFYLCRQIVVHKEFKSEYKKEPGDEYTWLIHHCINSNEDNKLGWRKYREDELTEAPQELIDLILNKGDE